MKTKKLATAAPTSQPATVKPAALRKLVARAYQACESKKAEDITLLELGPESSSFTDYFLICTGSNPRQVQAIADEISDRVEALGGRPNNIEGYRELEWVLMDYVDFVVHIFSPQSRKFYDLERLWKSASRLTVEELTKPRPAAKKTAVKRDAGKKADIGAASPAARRSGAKPRARARSLEGAGAPPRKATRTKRK